MDSEVKKLWVEALRSGEYEQGRNKLQQDGKFCCNGVLCDLAVKRGIIPEPLPSFAGAFRYGGDPNAASTAFLPPDVCAWAGLDEEDPKVGGDYLTAWNDGTIDDDGNHRAPMSFTEIADLIEEHL